MKYIVVYDTGTDCFTDEFNDKDEAIAFANMKWEHLTEMEKEKASEFYVLDSINPDEYADNHFDGTPILVLKERG